MGNNEAELLKIPTDCYACWYSAEDCTDGEWCYELQRSIRWYRERRSKPLDCPVGKGFTRKGYSGNREGG